MIINLGCSRFSGNENHLSEPNHKVEKQETVKKEKGTFAKVWNPDWLEDRPNWMKWAWRAGPGH